MRTAIYIDGFNLYYGVVRGTPYKWLDLRLLCQNLIQPHHRIGPVIYCTARVQPSPTNPNTAIRQDVYLKALQAHTPEFKPIYGHFMQRTVLCRPVDQKKHGRLVEAIRMEEKGSDVNLAVHLVNDARTDRYDCAVVVSNDSDLAEAMRIAKEECGKVVGLLTPGTRRLSKRLRQHAHFQRRIRERSLAGSQLPSPIPGTHLIKPAVW